MTVANEAAESIAGTGWRAVAVPSGMTYEPRLGFKGSQELDFAETVVCEDETVSPTISVEQYAHRQIHQLRLFAPDLKVNIVPTPKGLVSGEHVVFDVAFTYDKARIWQMHTYVRGGVGIGTAVWTHKYHASGCEQRFWEVLNSLRYG